MMILTGTQANIHKLQLLSLYCAFSIVCVYQRRIQDFNLGKAWIFLNCLSPFSYSSVSSKACQGAPVAEKAL